MGGCAFLVYIYEWVWLFRTFVWVAVAGCDWV